MRANSKWNKIIGVPLVLMILFGHLPFGVAASASIHSGWKEMATGSVHNNGYVGDGNEWWRTEPVWVKSYDNEALIDNPISVEVNGKSIEFDQPPVVMNGRTMVPLRLIFDALGAEMVWDQTSETVTATRGATTVKLTIGATIAYVNGEAKALDSPAIIINERTLVPARFIGESLGAKVGWNEETWTVSIESIVINIKSIEQISTDPNLLRIDNSRFKGRVVGNNQVGVPDVHVRVRSDSASINNSMSTDSKGFYSADGLENGEQYYLDIHIMSQEEGSIITHNSINYCRPSSESFTFANNKLPTISLQEVQLTGKVIDENEKPVMAMTVLVADSKNSLINGFSTITNAEGSFPLCGLIAGEEYKMSLTQFFTADSDSIEKRRVTTSGDYKFIYDSTMKALPDYKVTYKD